MALRGHEVVRKEDNSLGEVEYTVPDPVEVFGRPISRISVRTPVGDYVEYSAPFSGEAVETVARLANIPENADGRYLTTLDGRELALRPEAGATYIACAQARPAPSLWARFKALFS
jgi:hypothetical protein